MSESGGVNGWGWGVLVFLQSHAQGTSSSFIARAKAGCCIFLCLVGLSPADIKVKGEHLLLRSMSVCTMLCTKSENNILFLSVFKVSIQSDQFCHGIFIHVCHYILPSVIPFPMPFKAFFSVTNAIARAVGFCSTEVLPKIW